MTTRPHFEGKTVLNLLGLYADLMNELREREAIRSSNNPVGDYSESLTCQALKLRLCNLSNAGYDALSLDGTKYEVKSRRIVQPSTSRQLSAIRNLKDNKFDYLVIVLFKPDFRVMRACKVPHSAVLDYAKYRKHTNSWILMARDTLWEDERVEDITSRLALAQSRM